MITELKEGMRVFQRDGEHEYGMGVVKETLDVLKIWIKWERGPNTFGTLDYWLGVLILAEPEKKDTNPKDALGIAKAPLSTVPTPFVHAVGLAMMEGALKYGRHNYRPAGIRYSVYFDALMRHMTLWWEGEDVDPDSGLPHPIKAAACLAILFDSMTQKSGTDDRPPRSPEGWTTAMNEHAKDLIERFPDPMPPHTHL